MDWFNTFFLNSFNRPFFFYIFVLVFVHLTFPIIKSQEIRLSDL